MTDSRPIVPAATSNPRAVTGEVIEAGTTWHERPTGGNAPQRGNGAEAVGSHVLEFLASEQVAGPGVVLGERPTRKGTKRVRDAAKKEDKRVKLGFVRWR